MKVVHLSPVEEKVLNKGRFLGLHSALKLNIYLWKSFYLAYPETFWLGFREVFSKLNNDDSLYDRITVANSTSVELLSIQSFAVFCFVFVCLVFFGGGGFVFCFCFFSPFFPLFSRFIIIEDNCVYTISALAYSTGKLEFTPSTAWGLCSCCSVISFQCSALPTIVVFLSVYFW